MHIGGTVVLKDQRKDLDPNKKRLMRAKVRRRSNLPRSSSPHPQPALPWERGSVKNWEGEPPGELSPQQVLAP
jgi:hypothetical protein